MGAHVVLPEEATPVDALASLFGEAPSRVVVSVTKAAADRVLAMAKDAGVPAARIGETGGDALAVAVRPLGTLTVPVAEVRARRDACLEAIVGK